MWCSMARACRIFDILPNSNDRKFQSPHCNIMEKTRQNTQEATFFSFLTPSLMFAVLGMILGKTIDRKSYFMIDNLRQSIGSNFQI